MPFHLFKTNHGRAAADVAAAESGAARTAPAPAAGAVPQQPTLRPLLLVARQEARAAENAARRTPHAACDGVVVIAAEGSMPAPVPQPLPQQFTAAPSPLFRPVRPLPPSGRVAATQVRFRPPSRVTYNVNDRIERARALRAQAASAQPLGAPLAPWTSELPYLAEGRSGAAPARPAGQVLPEAAGAPEEPRPPVVPPRRSSLEVYRQQGRGGDEAATQRR